MGLGLGLGLGLAWGSLRQLCLRATAALAPPLALALATTAEHEQGSVVARRVEDDAPSEGVCRVCEGVCRVCEGVCRGGEGVYGVCEGCKGVQGCVRACEGVCVDARGCDGMCGGAGRAAGERTRSAARHAPHGRSPGSS